MSRLHSQEGSQDNLQSSANLREDRPRSPRQIRVIKYVDDKTTVKLSIVKASCRCDIENVPATDRSAPLRASARFCYSHALDPIPRFEPRKMSAVITRFAPSPTGFLHIGGARTALFN